MKEAILNILQCPVLKSDFKKISVFKSEVLTGINGDPFTNIDAGLLINEQGNAYPIIDGVPRLIEGALFFNKAFCKQWEQEIGQLDVTVDKPSIYFEKFILPTLKRFEKEWKEHDLNEKTWGLDQKARVEQFLLY